MNKICRITCYLPDNERARFVMVRRDGFYRNHFSISDATMKRLGSTCLRMTGKINVLPMGWSWRRGVK